MSGNVPFSRWPENYKFAYMLAYPGMIVGLSTLVWGLIKDSMSSMGLIMAGLLFVVCLALIIVMPRMALDGEEEKARRTRSRELRTGSKGAADVKGPAEQEA